MSAPATDAASWVALSELRPWVKNPRKNDHAVEKVAASLSRFGWGRPLVVGFGDWGETLVAGHTTLKAALYLERKTPGVVLKGAPGPRVAPVRRQAFTSEREAHAYALADNKTAEASGWDDDLLEEVFVDFWANGVGVEDLGWDSAEIREMLEPAPARAEPSDDAPEPPAIPVSRLGKVYELGPHRLVCGDSTKPETWAALLRGEKVQMVWTDPPYGMRLQTDYSRMGHGGGRDYRPVIGDDADFDPSRVMCHVPDVAEQFWWGADYYRASLPKGGGWFVWDKRWNEAGMDLDALFGASFELCWSMVAHKRDIIRILWATSHGREKEDIRGVHPTQKPVALARWFISRWAQPAGVVADPFGGSGTTLLAAASEGRVARLIELDPRYCDVIRRRWTTYADANGLDAGPGALRTVGQRANSSGAGA